MKFDQKVRMINSRSVPFYMFLLLAKKGRLGLARVKNARERLTTILFAIQLAVLNAIYVVLICFSNEEAGLKFLLHINVFPLTNISIFHLACLLLASSKTTEISHYKRPSGRMLLSAFH